jgi:choline dehydrogenase-like flavoprotein
LYYLLEGRMEFYCDDEILSICAGEIAFLPQGRAHAFYIRSPMGRKATELPISQAQRATAKMGRDAASIINGRLKVHGIDGPRVADASILPRVTAGNTKAPCVVIGEQAAAFLQATRS